MTDYDSNGFAQVYFYDVTTDTTRCLSCDADRELQGASDARISSDSTTLS